MSYTITNIGDAEAGPFKVKAILDPSQSVDVIQDVAGGFGAGDTQTISVVTPAGGNCFDPDCTVTVFADNNNDVEECNEESNQKSETTPD